MRVTIDPSMCSGHGRCYVLHPELFEPDDEGYGHPREIDVPEEIGRGVLLDCPEQAIRVLSENEDQEDR